MLKLTQRQSYTHVKINHLGKISPFEEFFGVSERPSGQIRPQGVFSVVLARRGRCPVQLYRLRSIPLLELPPRRFEHVLPS